MRLQPHPSTKSALIRTIKFNSYLTYYQHLLQWMPPSLKYFSAEVSGTSHSAAFPSTFLSTYQSPLVLPHHSYLLILDCPIGSLLFILILLVIPCHPIAFNTMCVLMTPQFLSLKLQAHISYCVFKLYILLASQTKLLPKPNS